jgi:hypothetical protein
MKYRGQRLVYSIGETVKSTQWSSKKQKLKNTSQTTKDGELNLNDLLNNLEKVVLNAYNTEKINGIPSPGHFKEVFERFHE